MRILLAAADRDLLVSLGDLLTVKGNEVRPVFDGAQALKAAATERFDAAAADSELPLLDVGAFIDLLKSEATPAVIMKRLPVTAAELRGRVAASYLQYPFYPDELADRLTAVSEKTVNGAEFVVEGLTVSEKSFTLGGRLALTNEETDILAGRVPMVGEDEALLYFESVRAKLRRLGKTGGTVRIVNAAGGKK